MIKTPVVKMPGDPGDLQADLERRPEPPRSFSVGLGESGATLLFTIGDVPAADTRITIDEFRVYFAPASLATNDSAGYPDPETATGILIPQVARRVFEASELVGSVSSVGRAGTVAFEDARFVGKAGWFFCTSVNRKGFESVPTPAFEAFLGGGTTPSGIPPSLTFAGVEASIRPVNVGGRTYAQITVSAVTPNPPGSFAGMQMYLWNYQNAGLLEEGPFFAAGSTPPGSVLSGVFNLLPDVGPYYSTGTIFIFNGSTTIDGVDTTWDENWSNQRKIEFYGIDQATTDGTETTYVRDIGVVSSVNLLDIVGTAPWRSAARIPYAIMNPETQGADLPIHRVRLYFVSVSAAGTRAPDIYNTQPYVEFQFGIAAVLSAPLNPLVIQASSQDATVLLTWQVTSASVTDTTIRHFNIYRSKAGDYLSGPDTAPLPFADPLPFPYVPLPGFTVFATVVADRGANAGGIFKFVDNNFDLDPSSPTWDLNPTNPSYYQYWVTSVNLEGTENRAIVPGANMLSSPVLMLGHLGGGDDPTSYQDTFSNRLFNARLFDVPAVAGVNEPFATSYNSGYATKNLADGQPTFKHYFAIDSRDAALFIPIEVRKIFASDGVAPLYGQAGLQTAPAAAVAPLDPSANDDSWSAWQYIISSGAMAPPAFVASIFQSVIGDIVFPAAGAVANGYSVAFQMVKRQKFQNGENLVLSAYVKRAEGVAAGSCILRLQMIRFDDRNYSNAVFSAPSLDVTHGIERDVTGGDWSDSTFTTDYQSSTARYSLIGKLPRTDPVITVGVTNGSFVITSASGELMDNWVGCPVSIVQGATTLVSSLRKFSGGTGQARTTAELVPASLWVGTTGTATMTVTIQFTHYAFKFGIIHGSTPYDRDVYLTRPMANGGRVGAAWTGEMRIQDEPGGATQGGGISWDVPPDPCVTAGHKVLCAGGIMRPIETIEAGVEVIGWERRKGLVKGIVVRRIEATASVLLTLGFASGRSIRCTEGHPFLRVRHQKPRFVEARRLQMGDVVLGELDGTIVAEKITSIQTSEEAQPVPVFTLSVEPCKSYVVGGLVSHNKPINPDVQQ